MNIVVNTYPFEAKRLRNLILDFPEINFSFVDSKNEYEEKLPSADAVFTIRLNKNQLALGRNIKWIQGLMAGADLIPLEKIKERNILLTTGSGIHKDHMTEYTISMMILDARNLDKVLLNKFNKDWNPSLTQDEIKEKTLCILGLGSIGKELAKKSSFMGMNVIGVKREYSHVPYVKKVFTSKNIYKAIEQSDYIVNLLPLTPETDKIINIDVFKKMKSSACMINIGRGATVDEKDLYYALKNKLIRKYISDVFNKEPLPQNSPLWELDNIIITPHICGSSTNYMSKAYDIVKTNLERYINRNKENMLNIFSFKQNY